MLQVFPQVHHHRRELFLLRLDDRGDQAEALGADLVVALENRNHELVEFVCGGVREVWEALQHREEDPVEAVLEEVLVLADHGGGLPELLGDAEEILLADCLRALIEYHHQCE